MKIIRLLLHIYGIHQNKEHCIELCIYLEFLNLDKLLCLITRQLYLSLLVTYSKKNYDIIKT